MPILRTVVDIEVSGDLTKNDVARYAESLKDYAAVVLGPELTEKTTAELNPEHWHHVHDGESGQCRTCRNHSQDDRS